MVITERPAVETAPASAQKSACADCIVLADTAEGGAFREADTPAIL
ncbi:hypothetical protein [Capsulimonas corticalis]|nr:hypothetical protein [Capsulimonas corticalis]